MCNHPEFVEDFLSEEGPKCAKCGISLEEYKHSITQRMNTNK